MEKDIYFAINILLALGKGSWRSCGAKPFKDKKYRDYGSY
jgi:hypothetical protein